MSPTTDWQPVQGVPCLSYYGIWIRLLPHSDPELDKQKEMGGCKLILVSCIQFQNCVCFICHKIPNKQASHGPRTAL